MHLADLKAKSPADLLSFAESLAIETALKASGLEARAIVAGADPESEFFRDLCVYDGYHESLVAACERALRGDYGLSSEDAASPDISFAAYLRWKRWVLSAPSVPTRPAP